MTSLLKLTRPSGGLWSQSFKQVSCFSTSQTRAHSEPNNEAAAVDAKPVKKSKSERLVEFQKKLRAKTPIGKLDELSRHPFQESEPLKPWPNNTNPHTGEIGGPAGPEPTRYGDWERKGRVSDF